MTSKLTREQAQKIIDAADAVMSALAGTNDEVHKDDTDKMIGLWDDLNDRYAPPEVVRNLASIALAAMDSEPVAFINGAWTLVYYRPPKESGLKIGDKLYRHAQHPVAEIEFIPKNLDKALGVLGMAIPESREEFNFQTERWIQRLIDRVIRYSDEFKEQTAPDQMLCDFYEVNSWPDLVRELVKHVEQLQDSAKRNVKPWEDTFPETLLPAYIERVKQADEACRAELAGNSPVIPDGYVMVPKEPTKEMIDAGWLHFMGSKNPSSKGTYEAMLAAAPPAPKQENI